MERIMFILLGGSLFILGFAIVVNPRFYDFIYNYYFDFTGYNIPLGIFIIVVGILFIWTSLKKRKSK